MSFFSFVCRGARSVATEERDPNAFFFSSTTPSTHPTNRTTKTTATTPSLTSSSAKASSPASPSTTLRTPSGSTTGATDSRATPRSTNSRAGQTLRPSSSALACATGLLSTSLLARCSWVGSRGCTPQEKSCIVASRAECCATCSRRTALRTTRSSASTPRSKSGSCITTSASRLRDQNG